MGDVISLDRFRDERRARCAAQPDAPVEVHVDLRSPWTYLLAERADRALRRVRWHVAVAPDTGAPDREAVEARAAALGMPLVWPDGPGGDGMAAMRVAALAVDEGRGAPFVLAAGRLAYCGGFDLGDPEILLEAAAAAGLGLDDCLAAVRDRARDEAIRAAGHALWARGATALPALGVGGRLFCGEHRLAEAVAAARPAVSMRA